MPSGVEADAGPSVEAAPQIKRRKQFFFEKKNQKTFDY
jgi:hypothetical protein